MNGRRGYAANLIRAQCNNSPEQEFLPKRGRGSRQRGAPLRTGPQFINSLEQEFLPNRGRGIRQRGGPTCTGPRFIDSPEPEFHSNRGRGSRQRGGPTCTGPRFIDSPEPEFHSNRGSPRFIDSPEPEFHSNRGRGSRQRGGPTCTGFRVNNYPEPANPPSQGRQFRPNVHARSLSMRSVSRAANSGNILNTILCDNDSIEQLLLNGDILVLLNSSSQLSGNQVHDVLSSFNQFKVNENSPRSIKEVFIMILNSTFIVNGLEPIVRKYFNASVTKMELSITLSFCINCLELLPSQFIKQMALLYPSVQYACSQIDDLDIQNLSKKLSKSLETAKHINEQPSLSLSSQAVEVYDFNFRKYSVVPDSSDIFCLNEEVPIRPNKIAGEDSKYESVDDYLDTHFCLLKEDFVRPLRDGIASIREDLLTKPRMEMKRLQIRLYENVLIEDLFTSRNGLVYKVVFDVTRLHKVDWKKAKRFIYGSLLCFTNNFFDTIFFATVVDSDPKSLEKGQVIVQFNNDPIVEVLENNVFMMIETKNLFEAYRHVLSKLQNFTAETLPFKEYLVFGENASKSPSFMNERDLLGIEYAGSSDPEFDNSQKKAFVNALRSRLSLIQGPPGTGKTYVGLKIIKYVENHFQTNERNIGPILVVCYTNHALDQFLFDIIEAIGIENVLRVGGRSKLEVMKDCNIASIRRKWVRKKAIPHYLFKRGIQNRRNIEYAEEQLIRKYVMIKNYDKRILSFEDIRRCLNNSQINYFRRVDFNSWIKGGDAMLDDTVDKVSELKKSVLVEESEMLIHNVVHEICLDLMRQLFLAQNSGNYVDDDLLVEDPDDYLYDQRFLAEDANLMQHGNQFQRLYEDYGNDFGETVSNDDEFKCVANVKLIKNKLKRMKLMTEEEYNEVVSLEVDFGVRLQLYKYWLEKYRLTLLEEYKVVKFDYELVRKEREEISFEEYIAIMRSVKVIGMTTTGAARYGSVLDSVGCRVVIIEEAAEVLESHVVCSLSKKCEQLIMIGDHKQLRPKVDVYDLEMNYNFGISLFERLIGNECEYFTLQFQHRMRPEISSCVRPIYPLLKDSDNVLDYTSIVGMRTDIYFFSHTFTENENNEMSYKNDFEAEFVAKLCEYLVKRGNLASSITVLTLYSGQLYNINGKMRHPMFKGIRICVVDNFQGEENEIIILSMVRSNSNDYVGFVKSDNRLCVALSRAKRGFYAIANFGMLNKKIELLQQIVGQHLDKKDFGQRLPLRCPMHPDECGYVVTNLQDFNKQGCPSQCGRPMGCGHVCQRTCHVDAPSHKGYKCDMPCAKQCQRNLHGCKLKCFQMCRCTEKIAVQLTCGHEKAVECWDTNTKCLEICEKGMECGHHCLRMCHQPCQCEIMIEQKLDCGHGVMALCGADLSRLHCVQVCPKTLACGHLCREKCSQKCKCRQLVDSVLPCRHERKLVCGTDVNEFCCPIVVEKDFPCGHSVKFKCSDKLQQCPSKVSGNLTCGHTMTVTCGENVEEAPCTYVCDTKLSCHHKCAGKCGDCYRARLHVICRERCRKYMKCRHYCDGVCHSGFCPPCSKPCSKYCEHSQCTALCGQVCDCQTCQLACQKNVKCAQCKKTTKCSKLCGERCSQLCLVCGKDDRMHYIMDPCHCHILKDEFMPEVKIEKRDISLACQGCHSNLRSPYYGPVLTFFKKRYSELFQPFEVAKKLAWVNLVRQLKIDNGEEMIDRIERARVCVHDVHTFDTAFGIYQEILEIAKNMLPRDGEMRINRYFHETKKLFFHLTSWLDPFVRNFGPQELVLIKVEIARLSLALDVLSYLYLVTVTDYALVCKQFFDVLDELDNCAKVDDIDILCTKVDEIKKRLENKRHSSEDEEKLVSRIIESKDIYKEFGLETFSVEIRLKKIKKLIVKCHPDKNKSARASEAVRILLAKKVMLEI